MTAMENQQFPIPEDIGFTTPRKVKLLASKNIKDFLGTEILSSPGFFYSKVKRFVKQLGSFADFAGELHAFFAKGRSPRYKEVNLVSEDGQDAVIRIYNNSKDRETDCSIPNYEVSYDKNWCLVQNEELFFFELDEIQNTLEPAFKKKVYCDKNGSVVATRCIDLSTHRKCHITFEVEKYTHTISFTMIMQRDEESLKLIEAYSCAIIQNLISGNNDTDASTTYIAASKSVYSYYEATKDLLEQICSNFIVSTVDDISGSCTSKLVVVDGQVYSFMLPDKDANYITVFKNRDWQLTGPMMVAKKQTADTNNESTTKRKTTFSLKTKDLSESEISKIPSLPDLRDYVERFIKTNLWFAFQNN
ncbi:MAG: hypothetical protein J6I85_07950 [Clostridia bacterium]|nr:hypothetical protein [Clostridia bacterium]